MNNKLFIKILKMDEDSYIFYQYLDTYEEKEAFQEIYKKTFIFMFNQLNYYMRKFLDEWWCKPDE